MKTTLVLDDALAARLRREADARGTSMSRIVEDALRRFLGAKPSRRGLRPLPRFDAGRPLVDLDDRDALLRAMEGEG